MLIGVVDSGFGGLSVLRHLRRRLPTHDFLYLGDSGRAPYGGRDIDTLLDFSEQVVERLFEEGARLCVVACNTVSCVALRHLQQRYASDGDRRILGVTIPGAELAVQCLSDKGLSNGRGRIGLLATKRTVRSGTYVTEIHKLAPHVSVEQVEAPLLAPIVEEGLEQSEIARLTVAHYLGQLGPVDAVLLGCTHYPFLADMIAQQLPSDTAVLDPAPFLADRLVDWLGRHVGFTEVGTGRLRVLCTGDPAAFAKHGQRFLGEPLPPVEPVAEHLGRLAHRAEADAPTGQVVRSGPRRSG